MANIKTWMSSNSEVKDGLLIQLTQNPLRLESNFIFSLEKQILWNVSFTSGTQMLYHLLNCHCFSPQVNFTIFKNPQPRPPAYFAWTSTFSSTKRKSKSLLALLKPGLSCDLWGPPTALACGVPVCQLGLLNVISFAYNTYIISWFQMFVK